jgi:hypothetical protein
MTDVDLPRRTDEPSGGRGPKRLDLAAELSNRPARQGRFPWPDHEYVRGWGVFGLPFDSGHYLALRVFPENDFAPYVTVWHRAPTGSWSIFADAPRLDLACPRYYGPACDLTAHAKIDVEWTGPDQLQIKVDSPDLTWTVTASETPLLRLMNRLSPHLPLWTWKTRPLLSARELLARRLLHVGPIRMGGTMPSGHIGTLMPERMYFIDASTAVLDGEDLGRPNRLEEPVDIGGVLVPSRGILAVGQAAWGILDPAEYERARMDARAGAQA